MELLKKLDIPACVGVFNYYAGCAYHVLGESSMNSANFLNVSVRQPYGVVGLIIPWNVRFGKPSIKQSLAILSLTYNRFL